MADPKFTPEDAFRAMRKTELRAYIDGCHRDRAYDADFELACRVFNDRHRDAVAVCEAFQAALQSYAHGNGSSHRVASAALLALDATLKTESLAAALGQEKSHG